MRFAWAEMPRTTLERNLQLRIVRPTPLSCWEKKRSRLQAFNKVIAQRILSRHNSAESPFLKIFCNALFLDACYKASRFPLSLFHRIWLPDI